MTDIKIRVVSDLHIDVNTNILQSVPVFGFEDELDTTDLLLIAGDTSGSKQVTDYYLSKLQSKNTTCYIACIGGNHLGYDRLDSDTLGNTKECINIYLRDKYKTAPVYFLENDYIDFNGYIIIGCTLYSNFNLYNNTELAKNNSEYHINDFKYVTTYDDEYDCIRPVTSDDYIKWFNKSLQYISNICKQHSNKKIIVLTHFAPSIQSIDNKYVGNILNPYYCTDLEDFIKENNNIKLWVHGHVHSSFDYNIGDTRVICEPYGYYGKEQHILPENYYGKILHLT